MLEHIPKGKANAIKRSDLCIKSGLKDRQMREKIAELQSEGYPIVNFQNGEGYFMASTEEEFIRYIRQERRRERTKSAVLTNMYLNVRREYFGQ